MTSTTRIILIVLGLLIIGGILYAVIRPEPTAAPVALMPTTFEECAAQYPVRESYPRQCATPDGMTFTEDVPGLGEPVTDAPTPTPGIDYDGNEDRIQVTSPTAGTRIASPLTITGSARGGWYFEATFPIEIRNAAGTVIATGIGQAQSDWTTENFVPFRATITFPTQQSGTNGTIVLRNDNPSGLPENARSITIPITF